MSGLLCPVCKSSGPFAAPIKNARVSVEANGYVIVLEGSIEDRAPMTCDACGRVAPQVDYSNAWDAQEKLPWQALRVWRAEENKAVADLGGLGQLLAAYAPSAEPEGMAEWGMFGDRTLAMGDVEEGDFEWEGYFLAGPDEEPHEQTPYIPVDWTGFPEAWAAMQAR